LGRLIFDGMRALDTDRIVAGTLVASLLALLADWGLAWLGEALRHDAGPVRRR
jgi:ABC-type proline/glycine betaine transport system permease subunit